MYMKQFLILTGAYGLGYAVSTGLDLPVPANVLGLLILFGALCLGWLKLSDVEDTADFIIQHLALFFMPPTVGIMIYFDLLTSSFLKIFVPLLTSILIGFFVAGQVTQLVIRTLERRRSGEEAQK